MGAAQPGGIPPLPAELTRRTPVRVVCVRCGKSQDVDTFDLQYAVTSKCDTCGALCTQVTKVQAERKVAMQCVIAHIDQAVDHKVAADRQKRRRVELIKNYIELLQNPDMDDDQKFICAQFAFLTDICSRSAQSSGGDAVGMNISDWSWHMNVNVHCPLCAQPMACTVLQVASTQMWCGPAAPHECQAAGMGDLCIQCVCITSLGAGRTQLIVNSSIVIGPCKR